MDLPSAGPSGGPAARAGDVLRRAGGLCDPTHLAAALFALWSTVRNNARQPDGTDLATAVAGHSQAVEPLHEAGIKGHARALVVRVPHLLVLLVWHFVALRCFHIEVPVHVAVLYLPVVFAVASLPISVQGLGTSQMAAKYFFSEFSPRGDAAVLAYSLTMTAIATASNLAMGIVLRAGAKLGLKEMTEEAQHEIDAEAAGIQRRTRVRDKTSR